MSRYPRKDLSPVLEHHTVREARADLAEYDHAYGLVASVHHAQMWEVIDDLCAAADENEFQTLADLTANSPWLIAHLGGVPTDRLKKVLPPVQANKVHLYRNMLLALVLAGVASYHGDARGIVKQFPALPRRSALMQRMHTDDETLLMRVWALHMSQGGDKTTRRTAAIYAQIDAGLCAGETTQVAVDDALLCSDSALIYAPGHAGGGGVMPRIIPLDGYNALVIQNHIDGADLSARSWLTYWPRGAAGKDAYASGCASAMGAINGMRQALGLKHTDTTCASITDWRAQFTFETKGYRTALELSGRTENSLDTRLGQRLDVFGTHVTPVFAAASKDQSLAI